MNVFLAKTNQPAHRTKRRITPGLVVKELVLILFTLSALVPIYFMVVTAFKTQGQYLAAPLALPHTWIARNFLVAFQAGFARWFANSAIIGVIAVFVVTVCASMAGFAFAMLYRRTPKIMITVTAMLMVIPSIVMLIPLYQMAAWANQIDTYQGVILIYSGIMMPFSVYMLTSFFRTVPRESIEAALIDGATPFRIYMHIVLPLSVSSLLTLAVVNLLWCWNELLVALVFLQTNSMRTLMVGISTFQGRTALNVPVTMAGLVIATAPIIGIYILAQKFFVRGLTMGAFR